VTLAIIFPLLTSLHGIFFHGCYKTLLLGGTPSSIFNDTYNQQDYCKKNIFPMKLYNIAKSSIYNGHPNEVKPT